MKLPLGRQQILNVLSVDVEECFHATEVSGSDDGSRYTPSLVEPQTEQVLELLARGYLYKEIMDLIDVSRGTLNSTPVHAREVFREAIAEGAYAVILIHNHPSGDPTPSPMDLKLTQQLVQAGNLLDIPVLDHIIVG